MTLYFIHYTVTDQRGKSHHCVSGPYTLSEAPDYRRDLATCATNTDVFVHDTPERPR